MNLSIFPSESQVISQRVAESVGFSFRRWIGNTGKSGPRPTCLVGTGRTLKLAMSLSPGTCSGPENSRGCTSCFVAEDARELAADLQNTISPFGAVVQRQVAQVEHGDEFVLLVMASWYISAKFFTEMLSRV